MNAGRSWMVAITALFAASALWSADGDYNFARISYVEGGFYLQRAQNYNTGEVGVNTPVGSGDSLWTESNARLEIEFNGGDYLRLDDNSRVDVRSVGGTNAVGMQGGSIFLDLRSAQPFRVDTPIASVTCYEAGIYRVDLNNAGMVTAAVYMGSADVRNSAGSVQLRTGEMTQVGAGRIPGYPTAFDVGRRDSFDDFQNVRVSATRYEAPNNNRYLPNEISSYGGELDSYGNWTYVSPYGNVWRPYDVAADWRPYRYGYWDYLPGVGYSWCGSEPWGWAPYHYGRWDFIIGVGWFWIPGHTWGPGWVTWSTFGNYLGWCPMNWYDRPVCSMNNYYGNWWGDNHVINPDSRSWTFIPKERIGGRDIGRVAIGDGEIRAIGKVTVSKDPIRSAPSEGITRTPIRGGAAVGGGGAGWSGSGGTVRRVDGGSGDMGRTGGGPAYRDGPKGGGSIGTSRDTGGGSGGTGTGGITRGGSDGKGTIRSAPNEGGPGITPRDNGSGGGTVRSGPGHSGPNDGGGTGGVTRGNGNGGSVRTGSENSGPKGGNGWVVIEPGGQGGTTNRGGPVYSNPKGSTRDEGGEGPGEGRVYYVPAPRDGTVGREPSGSGGAVYGSGDRSQSIQRYPEERRVDAGSPNSNSREGESGNGNNSFWGKVYDQFRSSSNGREESNGSSVQRGGSSSGSDHSGHSGGAPAVRQSQPPSSHSSPGASSPKGNSGGNSSSSGGSVRKKD